jgi:hypothetical protein
VVARPDLRRRPLSAVPTITGTAWRPPSEHQLRGMDTEVALDLGWGRLVFGQTFTDPQRLVEVLLGEAEGPVTSASTLVTPRCCWAWRPASCSWTPR